MTKTEFGKGILFLAAGLQKSLTEETMDAYFQLLGDLPFEPFCLGIRHVLLRHKWNTFPTIAELREAASEVMRGKASMISPAEAWQLAWDAAKDIDPDMTGTHRVYLGDGKFKEYPSQAAAVMDNLPKPVAATIRAYGLRELCLGDEPVGVVRGQFLKMYEQIAESEKRREMLPDSMRQTMDSIRDDSLIQKALAGIGDMPK